MLQCDNEGYDALLVYVVELREVYNPMSLYPHLE